MGIIILLLPLVLIFFMMQNQRKKAAQQQQLLNALVEGDDVVTTAGVYGTLTWVGKEEAFLEIGEGLEIHIVKGAIARKVEMGTTEAARVSEDGQEVEAAGATSLTAGSGVGAADVIEADLDVDGNGLPAADDVPAPAAEPKRRRLGGAK